MLSCSVTKSCLTLCDPLDYSPPGSLPMGFPKQEYWSGWPFPSPGDLPDPGLNSRLLHCQVDFFFFFFFFFYHWATYCTVFSSTYISNRRDLTCVCVLGYVCWLFATPWTVAYQAPLFIEPGSPTLQADSLPSEPPGKPQDLIIDYI